MPAALTAAMGPIACVHPDASRKITLVEAIPPLTICGRCFDALRAIVDDYHAGRRDTAAVTAAVLDLGFDTEFADGLVTDLVAEAA